MMTIQHDVDICLSLRRSDSNEHCTLVLLSVISLRIVMSYEGRDGLIMYLNQGQ